MGCGCTYKNKRIQLQRRTCDGGEESVYINRQTVAMMSRLLRHGSALHAVLRKSREQRLDWKSGPSQGRVANHLLSSFGNKHEFEFEVLCFA